jgi:hypothetical protein
VIHFATRQTPAPVYVGDCTDCPAATGAEQPGAANPDGFVAERYAGATPTS